MTDKPDDVSQEAWNAARGIGIYYSKPDPWMDRTLIARAIDAAVVAEREACAVVAEALERGEREWVPNSLWANIKADTARAIRARSKS